MSENTKKATHKTYSIKRGERFYHLTAIKKAPKGTRGSENWLCKCVCGNEVVIPAWALPSGAIRSCGCKKQHGLSICLTCGSELCDWLLSFPTVKSISFWEKYGLKIRTQKTASLPHTLFQVTKCPWWTQAPPEVDEYYEVI